MSLSFLNKFFTVPLSLICPSLSPSALASERNIIFNLKALFSAACNFILHSVAFFHLEIIFWNQTNLFFYICHCIRFKQLQDSNSEHLTQRQPAVPLSTKPPTLMNPIVIVVHLSLGHAYHQPTHSLSFLLSLTLLLIPKTFKLFSH